MFRDATKLVNISIKVLFLMVLADSLVSIISTSSPMTVVSLEVLSDPGLLQVDMSFCSPLFGFVNTPPRLHLWGDSELHEHT